ncbi:MAG: hypothetical protein KAT11_03810, partial [Phycisphaerae bacterium]|nr:hypothetical protein [Phycisphaerae bacterium]
TERLGITRTVRMLESALVEVPTVVGWLKPVILIPASSLMGISPQQLEAVLLHELAHIRRFDYPVNLLQTLAETLGFYHPAVWWVSRRIRVERENCCDDVAVQALGDKLRYARALARMEENRKRAPELAVAANGSSLLHRVGRLLGYPGHEKARLSQSWPVALVVIAAVLVAASLFINVEAETPATPPTEPPRAWHILQQADTNGLLHGLPQRLAKAIIPSKRTTPIWKGADDGGSLILDIRVDDDAKGEVFVGFFRDPRWHLAEPAQMRRFPGPGRYRVDRLPPGKYQIGAMVGSALTPKALGVHASYPVAVEVKRDKTVAARLLLSSKFKNMPFGQFSDGMLKGFLGQFGGLDPTRMITVRAVDGKGNPVPFCRVVFWDRDAGTFYESGTNEEGYAYCDQIDGSFSLSVQRFEFVPNTMAARFQYKRTEKIYDAKRKPVITLAWEPYPTGTGKVIGNVHNQYSQPLTQYYITIKREEGLRKGLNDYSSTEYRLPVTDPKGRFEIGDLLPGTYTARVRAFDYPTHVWSYDMVRFTIPEERNAIVELDVEVEAKELLYGRAIYDDGSPVHPGSYYVRFADVGKRYFSDLTKPDGRFRICLSQREREDVMQNSQGTVEIKDRSGHLLEVHIDTLSKNPKKPTQVILSRSDDSNPPNDPTARPPVETLTFGPVIERVITQDKELRSTYLDLDTGGYADIQGEPTSQMVRKAGVDVYCEQVAGDERMKLATSNLQLQPLSDDTAWDSSPEHVRLALDVASPYALTDTTRQILAFRTSEGSMGVLQIVGFTENPKGVKIRYKMVESAKPSKTEIPWGESVEGVQVRLQADKLKWKASETPSFKADVRNQGKAELSVLPAQHAFEVEVDGQWYFSWPPAYDTPIRKIQPDEQCQDIAISLSDQWWDIQVYESNRGPERVKKLTLKPGPHVLRVAYMTGPRIAGDRDRGRAKSSPVEIEIQAARQATGSGEDNASSLSADVADLPESKQPIEGEAGRRILLAEEVAEKHLLARLRADRLMVEHRYGFARYEVRQAQEMLVSQRDNISKSVFTLLDTLGREKLLTIDQQELLFLRKRLASKRASSAKPQAAATILPGKPGSRPDAALAKPLKIPLPVAPVLRRAPKGLRMRIPRVHYEEVTLAEALDDLRNKSGGNIVVNWKSLNNLGIDKTTTVSLDLRNVTPARVLKAILANLPTSWGRVSYIVNEGIVTIASSDDLDSIVVTRVYEIAYMMMETKDLRGGPRFAPGGGSRDRGRDGGR